MKKRGESAGMIGCGIISIILKTLSNMIMKIDLPKLLRKLMLYRIMFQLLFGLLKMQMNKREHDIFCIY